MARFEELMENEEFVKSLDNVESYDEIKEKFATEGVDIENIVPGNETEELTSNELENVAGGITGGDLVRIVKRSIAIVGQGKLGAARWGGSYGILLRAYYDIYAHGSATYSYSADEITRAAKYLGIE